jgi:hypothetical protein
MVIRLKGSNSGEQSLNRKESKALKAWLRVQGMVSGTIFPSRKRGPISRKTMNDMAKVYGERAGWPVKMRHCHTFNMPAAHSNSIALLWPADRDSGSSTLLSRLQITRSS